METNDFPQDVLNHYGKLKLSLASAVTEHKGHTVKTAWLNLVLDAAKVAAAAPASVLISAWTQDPLSSNSTPDLLRQMSNALARNELKSAGDNTLLTAIFTAAETELNA